MKRVLLVYHKPGTSLGYRIINIYANKIKRSLNDINYDISFAQLDEVLKDPENYKGSKVIALLFTKGRHYTDLKRLSEKGFFSFLGKIPLNLVINVATGLSESLGCHDILFLYHGQGGLDELDNLNTETKIKINFYSIKHEIINLNNHDCCISLTLLPSRLIEKTIKNMKCKLFIKYMFPLIYNELVIWIRSLVQRSHF